MNEDKNLSKIFEEFLRKSTIINNETNNHIYNMKYSKLPFILQFIQLINYYNYSKQFEKILLTGEIPDEIEKGGTCINNKNGQKKNTIQNSYCLIDKNWIEKWKKHVGYHDIINYCNNNQINRKLNSNDYKWISKIIEKNSIENYLNPLDMSFIYKNNEIDPLSDFDIIHKDCFILFSIGSKNIPENKNFKKYPIRFFKGKFIIYFNDELLWISFKQNKDSTNKKYFEIIINFKEKKIKEEGKEKKNVMNTFINEDINEWLNSIGFNLNSTTQKEITLDNCKIQIINKTLKYIQEKAQENNIYPNIFNKRNELLNTNAVSETYLILCQKTILDNLQKANNFMLKNDFKLNNGQKSFKTKIGRNIDNNIEQNDNINSLTQIGNKINTNKKINLDNNIDYKKEKNNNNINNMNLNGLNNTNIINNKNNINNTRITNNKDNINNINNFNENMIINNNENNNNKMNNNIMNYNNINIRNNNSNIVDFYNNEDIDTSLALNQIISNKKNNSNININYDNNIKNLALSNNDKNYNDNYTYLNINLLNKTTNFTLDILNDNIDNYQNNYNKGEVNKEGNDYNNNYNNNIQQNNNNYNNQFNNFNNNQQNNQIITNNNMNMNPQMNYNSNNINNQQYNFNQINQENNNNLLMQKNYSVNNNNLQVNNNSNFNKNDYLNLLNNYQCFIQKTLYLNDNNNQMNNQNSNFNNNINNYNFNNINNNEIKRLNAFYPHKTGLQNIGQTCYMNATIECLSNIKKITDVLLENYGRFDVNNKPLTSTYSNLLFDLFFSGKKYISPEIFKNIIGELNPLFQGMHAADAKDLLFFLIEKLHSELNPELPNKSKSQKNFYQLELESQNENITLQNFMNDFKLKNNSIISDTFYGIIRTKMKCNGCGLIKYSFQTFNMQIFQLKKIKDDKMAKMGNYYDNNIKLDLFDAFYNQQEEEFLYGENMIYCNNCNGLRDGFHQQSIYQLPYVLIIILNRGKNNEDFNEEFDFPEILDFNNHGVIINHNSYKKYYLCGIITHLGESGSGGHFIAYCRNNVNDNFLCYNDDKVTEVSIKNAMSSKISDNVLEKKTPYILFYHCLQ